ncbi:MAG: ribosomal-processing cysteine protease Prp [Lachnospiraceae bacterium]
MIEAILQKRQDTYEVQVVGHAGYDETGKDIVCAAVSILVQSFEMYCEETNGIRIMDKTLQPGIAMYFVTGEKSLIEPAYNMLKIGIEMLSENFSKNIICRGEKN